MTTPMPPEPHAGIKADAASEAQQADREASPGLARAGSSGAVDTGPAPADEQPSQAKDSGTAGGDALSGRTADEHDLEDAVSGDTGPERPGARS